ncbi:AsnC family protein [sulfur-oxidizing endosymbiont of Gigantopelta aegis]|uniref:siroheme decarboxylase subunit beta n=1 Tax=sulfur-oxidizing endosymbiont of Gigantopelta aegis TaxID=2794934 RepID=UPI001FED06B6|nr:AsnC family protein [sulfur-oxidizing endosymbiont of Gigantopelta aegis]
MTLNILDQQLIASIQDGLDFTAKPFVTIAEQLGISEQRVITRLQQLKDDGTIKRLGVVVRHRELGFKANAMVVWDIPDDKVAEIARRIASFECVTLCYQRPRRLPEWSYNLFSMIHGKDRESVLQRLDDLVDFLDLQDIKHEPLFSTRRFKQRGARYIDSDKIISRSISSLPSPLTTQSEQKQTIETKLAYG